MQTIAILSDIHGNLPALEAALMDAREQGASRFVFLGDYIFDMPWSNEVCRRLMAMDDAVCVAGNKEERLHTLRLDAAAAHGCEQFATVYETLRRLDGDVLDWLKALPTTALVPLEGGSRLRAMHWPYALTPLLKPRFSTQSYFRRCADAPSSHEMLLRDFDREMRRPEYAAFLDALDADVIAFGHNHMQHWCVSRGRVVLDCGAVGVTADFRPGAAYALLSVGSGGIAVRERLVAYDREAAIREAKKSALYAEGRIWCELLFRTIREGRDYMGAFLRYAYAMAEAEGEIARPLPNALWRAAYKGFTSRLAAGEAYPVFSSSEQERSV